MLNNIYGPTQNYSKSKFEILAHLSEVCGVAGKYLFKKDDLVSTKRFLPKIFGWACALLRSVQPREADLERIILQKFPGVCPYCQGQPCTCWTADKPTLDSDAINRIYYNRAAQIPRSPNDFEMMFSRVYGDSWYESDKCPSYQRIFLRLIEELAEVSEAVRFSHLYTVNFENEIADFMGWWFALSSVIRQADGQGSDTISDILWRAYPGHCLDCQSTPCFCMQGPVRELMSKPAPGHLHDVDQLTSLRNQGAYNRDLAEVRSGNLTFAMPIACVRADVDLFKTVNDTHGHKAGDEALKHIATMLRTKAGARTRLYRISGDEFGVLIPDSSEEEASGMMRRVLLGLSAHPVTWTGADGASRQFHVGMSIGVAQCDDPEDIEAAFERADKASYVSKDEGRGRVSLASASVARAGEDA